MQRVGIGGFLLVLLGLAALPLAPLSGCAPAPLAEPPGDPAAAADNPGDAPAKAPSHFSDAEKVAFYMERLGDPEYRATYGHGYPWYIAAEELGMIGKPAIRPLLANLDVEDDFERALTLYALLLASQHPSVAELTGGDYARATNAWDVESHPESARIAREWWERHKESWPDEAARDAGDAR